MDKRKELKLAYKQNPPPMGVYQIKNTATGKIFIGSHTNIPGKFNSNRMQLDMKSHPNKELQEDWNLYEPHAFSFDILETIDPTKVAQENWRKEVLALEEKWLEKLKPYGENGYNKEKKQPS